MAVSLLLAKKIMAGLQGDNEAAYQSMIFLSSWLHTQEQQQKLWDVTHKWVEQFYSKQDFPSESARRQHVLLAVGQIPLALTADDWQPTMQRKLGDWRMPNDMTYDDVGHLMAEVKKAFK